MSEADIYRAQGELANGRWTLPEHRISIEHVHSSRAIPVRNANRLARGPGVRRMRKGTEDGG